MPWINDPACEDRVSVIRWIKYHVGGWMRDKGFSLIDHALHPKRCKECGARLDMRGECDHIPF